MATSRVCSIPECGKPEKASGLCNTHYAQKWRARQPKCSEDGCDNAQVTRGLCDTHYRKVLERDGRVIAKPGEALPCNVTNCTKPHAAFGYCEEHYHRFKRHGDPLAGIASHGAGLAFIEEVLKRPPTDDCIVWPRPHRGKSRHCYPLISINGKSMPATRYICMRANGPPADDLMETCHSCANKRCVNPRHLRFGTPAENGADRTLHGTVARGERNPHAKLTDDVVRYIRANPENLSFAEMAKQLRVSPTAIGYAANRKTWKHIT